MIDYPEIELVTSTKLGQKNSSSIEKVSLLSVLNVSGKKAKRKAGSKDKIPLCNWTMPAQPQGYIRAGSYDLL